MAIYKVNKNVILESMNTYDKLVKKELDEMGLGQMEDRESPEKETLKQIKVDENKKNTEGSVKYFKTIYNNNELKELENPPKVNNLNIPKD